MEMDGVFMEIISTSCENILNPALWKMNEIGREIFHVTTLEEDQSRYFV